MEPDVEEPKLEPELELPLELEPKPVLLVPEVLEPDEEPSAPVLLEIIFWSLSGS
jgi:hypothetical protein